MHLTECPWMRHRHSNQTRSPESLVKYCYCIFSDQREIREIRSSISMKISSVFSICHSAVHSIPVRVPSVSASRPHSCTNFFTPNWRLMEASCTASIDESGVSRSMRWIGMYVISLTLPNPTKMGVGGLQGVTDIADEADEIGNFGKVPNGTEFPITAGNPRDCSASEHRSGYSSDSFSPNTVCLQCHPALAVLSVWATRRFRRCSRLFWLR